MNLPDFDLLKQQLTQHLKQIVRPRDPYLGEGGHFYVKEYLRTELQQWGDVQSQGFEVKGRHHENLILSLPALNTSSAINPILIGAHYDTVPNSPGADDNGTGLAVLLELARFFQEYPCHFPLQFVAFDLEEYGLWGSKAYVNSLEENKQKVRLMLSLEMLGYCDQSLNSQVYPTGLKYFYPSTGNFIALVSNFNTIFDVRKLSQPIRRFVPCEWLTVPLNGQFVADTRLSDHSPFWDAGSPALMVTDTANLRNPYYHTDRDRLETLDLDFLTKVCLGLMESIAKF
ncbi:MAG: M28 family peptidase [Microcystaceae cyanobacterium]